MLALTMTLSRADARWRIFIFIPVRPIGNSSTARANASAFHRRALVSRAMLLDLARRNPQGRAQKIRAGPETPK